MRPGRQQRVVQLAAEQVLRRQVGDGLGLGLHLRAERLQPAGHQLLADGPGEGEVQVVLRRAGQRHPLAELQPFEEFLGEPADVFEVGLDDGGGLGLGHPRIVVTVSQAALSRTGDTCLQGLESDPTTQGC